MILRFLSLLLLQVFQQIIWLLPLSVEVKCQIVNGLVPTLPSFDAVLSHVVQGIVHGIFLEAPHERWYKLGDVDALEVRGFESVESGLGALFEKHRGVPQHHTVSSFLIIDLAELGEGELVVLFVDVVHDNGLVALHILCKLYALVNLAMGLQHLEDSVLMDVHGVINQKCVEVAFD